MIRAVLDTNVLVSALIVKHGKPAQILNQLEKFQLLLSTAILAETRDVLYRQRIRRRYPLSDALVNENLDALLTVSVMVTVQQVESVILNDPPDNLVLACAVAGAANYLVSGNDHSLRLAQYRRVRMVTPSQFLEILANGAAMIDE